MLTLNRLFCTCFLLRGIGLYQVLLNFTQKNYKYLLGTIRCFLSRNLNAYFKVSWFFCNLARTRSDWISKFSSVTSTEPGDSSAALFKVTKQHPNKIIITIFTHMLYNIVGNSFSALGFGGST